MNTRVLCVAPLPPPVTGGIANWVRIVRKRFADHPNVELEFVDSAVRWRRETTHNLTARLIGGSLQAIRDTICLHHKLRTNKFDVIHLCSSASLALLKDAAMLTLAKRRRIPAIIHYRIGTIPALCAQSHLPRRLITFASRTATCVIVLDNASQDAIHAESPDSWVECLPNVVDVTDIDSINANTPTRHKTPCDCVQIVFAGHVVPAKGVAELVEACLRLKTPWTLHIVGAADPTFQSNLASAVSSANASDKVHFHGFLPHDEVIRTISSADIFALPSYTEGAPNVILEAMSCNTPVVASAVGAIPYMLDIHSRTPCGICIHPRNVLALTDALQQLADNRHLRDTLSRRARQRVEGTFDVRIACQTLLDLWQRVAATQRSHSIGS